MRLGGEVDDRLGIRPTASATAAGSSIAPCTKRISALDIVQVLPPPRVGELVEHGHLVAVLAHAQTRRSRADEPGAAADQQPHVDADLPRPGTRPARPARPAARARPALACPARCMPGAAPAAAGRSVVPGLTSQSSAGAGHDLAGELKPRARPGAGHVDDALRAIAAASATSASARWPVNVGQPTWSSTTLSSSRSPARRRIVAGKQGPSAPNSHDVRTIVCASGRAARHRALAGELRAPVRRERGGRRRTRGTARAWSRRRRSRWRRGSSRRRPRPPPRATWPAPAPLTASAVSSRSRRRRRRSTRRS